MSTSAYDDALSRAQQLDQADQLRLSQALAEHIQRQTSNKRPRSIRELRGLGREIWEGVDPRAYVDAERDSWHGKSH